MILKEQIETLIPENPLEQHNKFRNPQIRLVPARMRGQDSWFDHAIFSGRAGGKPFPRIRFDEPSVVLNWLEHKIENEMLFEQIPCSAKLLFQKSVYLFS